MNLETKITIYKFTPQLFTLTRYVSLYNISQIAMMCPILPPKQNR